MSACSLTLSLAQVVPEGVVRLGQDTEVLIAPKERKKIIANNAKEAVGEEKSEQTAVTEEIKKSGILHAVFRVQKITNLFASEHYSAKNPYPNVLFSPDQLCSLGWAQVCREGDKKVM